MRNDFQYTCLEKIYMSLILAYSDADPEIIHMYAWDFMYLPPQKRNIAIDFRIGNYRNLGLQQEIMRKYSGVQLHWEKGVDLIGPFASNNPYIIEIDSYWCPWSYAFHLDHVLHYIIGIRYTDNGLICQDSDNLCLLPLLSLKKGTKRIGTLSFVPNQKLKKEIEFYKTLDYVNTDYGLNCFDSIRAFTDEIQKNGSLFQDGFNDIRNSSLLIALTHIINGRKKYVNVWEKYNMELKNPYVSYVTKELTKIHVKWRNLFNQIIKYYYTKTGFQNVINQLREIANIENKILENSRLNR